MRWYLDNLIKEATGAPNDLIDEIRKLMVYRTNGKFDAVEALLCYQAIQIMHLEDKNGYS